MRMFGWDQSLSGLYLSRGHKAYRFDVPVRHTTDVEVPDPFDHAQKLNRTEVRSEPLLYAGRTLKLARRNRSASG